LNVLLVVPWDQEHGGVASVVGNLARQLERRGHNVVFFHPGEPERPQRRTTKWGFAGYVANLRAPFVSGRPVRSPIGFFAMLLPTLFRLRSLLRSHRIEVVNVHYPLESFVGFGLLRRLLPFQLVVSVHGADLFPAGARRTTYPRSLRLLLRSADAIVAPSRAFLSDVVSLFPEIASRGLTIHNGVDRAELEQPNGGGPLEHSPYLLCVAAHNEKKAIEVLIRAFARIAPSHSDLHLVLVGDGPLRGELEALARSLALADRIAFLGSRARSDVAQLLRGSRVFVLPSRSEPFGIAVLEALASGCAVVASAVGGIPEIIVDGESGILVAPDDPEALARAIARVLDEPKLRESLAQAGRARAADFTVERMGERYESVYGDLLSAS
jgi:glycosyltransferase involved in cell wall biosynthesis